MGGTSSRSDAGAGGVVVGGVEGCFKGAVEGSVLGGGAARAAGGRGEGLLAEGGRITVKRDLAETAGSVRAAKRKASDGLILGPTRKSARCAAQRGLVAGMQALPDDVLEVIFGRLAGAASPTDYFHGMLTCKRFHRAGLSKQALSRAGEEVLAVRAESWHRGASAFADAAVAAGSTFALFFVGSVKFYCAGDAEQRKTGAALLAKAAVAGSPEAHHSLAIMHFNGSGGKRKDKDPEAGAELCARGNILFGFIPAKRELGHCLQDGFGVEQDAPLGRRLLAEAAKQDAQTPAVDAAVTAATAAAAAVEERLRKRNDINTLHAAVAAAAEVSAAAKTAAEAHLTATPENRFLLDWYGRAGNPLAPGTHACSHPLCGRVETRRHEFRRCSCCGRVRYCSRSCQSMDWRLQHKFACLPLLELYGWVESDAESTETAAVAGGAGGNDAGASSSAASDVAPILPGTYGAAFAAVDAMMD